jgi:hypothetical protein
MTQLSRRAVRSLAAVAFVAVGAAATAPSPAGAALKPGFTLKPGQKVVINAPSPPLQGKADLFGGLSPADCDTPVALLGSDEFCDSYPITIDASNALILSGNLQLNAVLEFAKGPAYVPNCPQIGNCGSNEMGVAIWQNPPGQHFPDRGPVGLGECDPLDANLPPSPVRDEVMTNPDICGEPTAALTNSAAESTGLQGTPDSPLSIAHIGAGICAPQLEPDPDNPVPADNVCKIEHVSVGNYTGDNPYKLTIELIDFSGGPPVDLSGEADIPVQDLSGDTPPAVTSSPTGFSGSGTITFDVPALTPPASSGAPRVDLPGLGSSAGFDGIGAVDLGGGDLARRIVERGPKALGAAGPASGLLLLLWLVLLPLGGLGSFLFFVWRRRRAEDEAAPATPVAA